MVCSVPRVTRVSWGKQVEEWASWTTLVASQMSHLRWRSFNIDRTCAQLGYHASNLCGCKEASMYHLLGCTRPYPIGGSACLIKVQVLDQPPPILRCTWRNSAYRNLVVISKIAQHAACCRPPISRGSRYVLRCNA